MRTHDIARYVKAESFSVNVMSHRIFTAVEGLKNLPDVILVHCQTVIRDRYKNFLGFPDDIKLNSPAFRRIFDRVIDKVLDCPPDKAFIAYARCLFFPDNVQMYLF